VQAGVIFRVFIASPSDVQKERDLAVDVVTQWNATHSLDKSAILEAVRIETHARAESGDHPQTIINRQLLEYCDFLIAIFWSKLGTETEKAVSGTVEEITEFSRLVDAENVMIFFSEKNIPQQAGGFDFERLKEFKELMQKKSLYIPYKDESEFRHNLTDQIAKRMNDLIKQNQSIINPENVSSVSSDYAGNPKDILRPEIHRLSAIFSSKFQDEKSNDNYEDMRVYCGQFHGKLDDMWDHSSFLSSNEYRQLRDLVLEVGVLFENEIDFPPISFWNYCHSFNKKLTDFANLL